MRRRPAEPSGPLPTGGDGAPTATTVSSMFLHRMRYVDDIRGSLTAGEFPTQIPFIPKRYFMVFDVSGKQIREEHAHRRCHLFLLCVRGSVALVVDDGRTSEEIVLDQPNVGVRVPPMIWAVQYKYSADAVLLTFASDPYDPDDYIRDYDEFLSLVGR